MSKRAFNKIVAGINEAVAIARGAQPISTTARILSIDDLLEDEFRVVATRDFEGRNWFYLVPDRHVKQLHEQVGHGDIVSVQRREDDGSWVLLAKLARPVVRGRR